MATVCEKCQEPIPMGAWPFCPHGRPEGYAVHGDEIDYIDHNLGREPIRIRSKAERRRLMAERGLREAVRHVPHPAGTKKDQTIDWSARPDSYTMRNRRELLERAFRQPADPVENPVYVPIEPQVLTGDEVQPYLEKK